MNYYLGVAAGWDMTTFLATVLQKVQQWGGQILMIIGAAMLVYTGVKLWNKIYGNPQKAQETSWVKIVAGVLIGGALLMSGFSIMRTISSGGSQTIRELGGGDIVFSQIAPAPAADAVGDLITVD